MASLTDQIGILSVVKSQDEIYQCGSTLLHLMILAPPSGDPSVAGGRTTETERLEIVRDWTIGRRESLSTDLFASQCRRYLVWCRAHLLQSYQETFPWDWQG